MDIIKARQKAKELKKKRKRKPAAKEKTASQPTPRAKERADKAVKHPPAPAQNEQPVAAQAQPQPFGLSPEPRGAPASLEEFAAEQAVESVWEEEEEEAAEREDLLKVLVFRLGREYYGINIMDIQSIIPLLEVTRVPRTPDYVAGIISLRGIIYPILDLKKHLSIAEHGHGEKKKIVILKHQQAGIIIDSVAGGVYTIGMSDMQEAPMIQGAIDAEFILGVQRTSGFTYSLLNINGLIEQEIKEDVNRFFTAFRFSV